jgi:hypothetical protein
VTSERALSYESFSLYVLWDLSKENVQNCFSFRFLHAFENVRSRGREERKGFMKYTSSIPFSH